MTVIGLVGCGNWGKNILRDLIALHCKVCVSDIDAAARSRAAANGAFKVVSRLDSLPDCDGYVVAVPIPELTRVTASLLKFKKPVFSEKTLCLSMADFQVLQDLGGTDYIYAMHKWHYHPGIEALRNVAESGRIGTIEEVCTTRYAWVHDFHGGDVFWNQAVHDITIVKHILGCVPEKVRTIHVRENECGLPVSFIAIIGDNPTVTMSVSGRHCDTISGVSIHGSKGSAMLHDGYDGFITIQTEEGTEKLPIDTTFPLYLELKEFVGYLEGGPRPRCDLFSAGEITQAILHLKEAALYGKSKKLQGSGQ